MWYRRASCRRGRIFFTNTNIYKVITNGVVSKNEVAVEQMERE